MRPAFRGISEPNTVVMAESTRKLLGNLFDLNDLGAQDLKGIGGRVRAWAALRPGSAEGRFEALHASGLTELVGREKNSNFCFGAGQRQRPAKAKWCSCRERQALASHGSRRRCLSASPTSSTLPCAISALFVTSGFAPTNGALLSTIHPRSGQADVTFTWKPPAKC